VSEPTVTPPEKRPGAGDALRSAARMLAPLVALALMAALFTALRPRFLAPESLVAIGEQAAIIVIVGIGQTFVIIAGGIDLSVGSVVAFSGTLAAVLTLSAGMHPLAAAAVGVLAGGVIGFFNGTLTTRTRLHPFIITLGSMMIFRGLAQWLTDARNTSLLPATFTGLASGEFPLGPGRELVIPSILLWYIVGLGILAHLLLTRTRFGRYCFAIGSNAQGARLSGIPVDRLVTLYFVLAGLLFGFGGVVQAARTGIGEPTGAAGMELEAIAAAVIGGASLSGGQGTIGGTILGALLMATLRQGLRMMNLPPYWQQVALGAAIIIAVIYDRASRRRSG
jgi:ribose transport system permease protein